MAATQTVPELSAQRLACGREEGEGFYSLEDEEGAFNSNPIRTFHSATCGET